jgi:maleate isomerase
VIVPSTNTVVEHDFNMIGPSGVTFHTGRMYIKDSSLGSDRSFLDVLEQIRQSIDVAIRDVLTCEPDYLVMGMSAETFWGGLAGNAAFEERVATQSGLGVSTGATSVRKALEAIGAEAVAILTPYQPVADEQVKAFFEEVGVVVKGLKGLRCQNATAIADVSPATLIPLLRELDGPDVDAIVQVGTNLSMVRLADEAERWLGKPIIAVNAATLWHALRTNGFEDRFPHFGSLLRNH